MIAAPRRPDERALAILILVVIGVLISGLLSLSLLGLGFFVLVSDDPASALTREMGAMGFGVLGVCGLPATYRSARARRGARPLSEGWGSGD